MIRGCKASTSNITTSIRPKGLFFGVDAGEAHRRMEQQRAPSAEATTTPPAEHSRRRPRGRPSRGSRSAQLPYVINWDSIACESRDFLVMADPFHTYEDEVTRFLNQPR